MLTLTHDQRGLLDYLAHQVHELARAANDSVGIEAKELLAEAEELRAIRKGMIERFEIADSALQLQLPLDIKRAA